MFAMVGASGVREGPEKGWDVGITQGQIVGRRASV